MNENDKQNEQISVFLQESTQHIQNYTKIMNSLEISLDKLLDGLSSATVKKNELAENPDVSLMTTEDEAINQEVAKNFTEHALDLTEKSRLLQEALRKSSSALLGAINLINTADKDNDGAQQVKVIFKEKIKPVLLENIKKLINVMQSWKSASQSISSGILPKIAIVNPAIIRFLSSGQDLLFTCGVLINLIRETVEAINAS